MTWHKIEIEFQDEHFTVEEVESFLQEKFRHESGIPLAVITVVSNESNDSDDNYASPIVAAGAWNPHDPVVVSIADAVWAQYKPNWTLAVKEFRTRVMNAGVVAGLKEAKDAIDAARARNP